MSRTKLFYEIGQVRLWNRTQTEFFSALVIVTEDFTADFAIADYANVTTIFSWDYNFMRLLFCHFSNPSILSGHRDRLPRHRFTPNPNSIRG